MSEQVWKNNPSMLRDSELIRFVTSDPDCTPLERNLALRLDRVLYAHDTLESAVVNARCEEQSKQLSLF